MDQATRETRLARCYALWAAAANVRRHRTHQQDQTARRNQRKARILTFVADSLLVTAVVAVAVTFNHLTPRPANDFMVAAIVTVGAAANEILGRLFTQAFGPTIDRLRGLEAKGADQ